MPSCVHYYAVLCVHYSGAETAEGLQELKPGALLHALPATGCNLEEVYLEILAPWDSSTNSFTAAWQGRLLQLTKEGQYLTAVLTGTLFH